MDSDHDQLTVVGQATPYHDRSHTKRDCGSNVLRCVCCISMLPHPHTSVCGVKKEPAFIRPVNPSPCPQVPTTSRQAPCKAIPAMNISQHRTLYHPPWPQTCRSESIPHCTWRKLPVWKPVLLQNGTCRKRIMPYVTEQVAIFACWRHMRLSRPWTVLNVIGLPMLLGQSAYNRMVVTELTTNISAGHARINRAYYSPPIAVR